MRHSPFLALLFAGAVLSAGCSFSYSSESSSDSSKSSSESSSSPFESSSDSSADDEQATAEYQSDVAEYTRAQVVAGAGGSVLGGVGALAEERGVSSWETDPATWRGLGSGLARAEVSTAELADYQRRWATGNQTAAREIRRGYEAAR